MKYMSTSTVGYRIDQRNRDIDIRCFTKVEALDGTGLVKTPIEHSRIFKALDEILDARTPLDRHRHSLGRFRGFSAWGEERIEGGGPL